MADLPSQLPRWGDTTPGNITEPTEIQKGVGFPAGNPRRQFMNWLLNLGYQWLAWLNQVTFRFGYFGPDQALAAGPAPSTGAGLTVAAVSFSGAAFVSGYLVSADAPAHTYAINSDTYWDLGRDGVWDANVVAAGDPAPTLVANHTRVYMVATNGVDRTAVTDFRNTRIQFTTPLDISSVRFGEDRRASASQYAEPRTIARFGTATGFTCIRELTSDGTFRTPWREFIDNATGNMYFVRGADWDGTQWVRDNASPTPIIRLRLLSTSAGGTMRLEKIDAPSATFADSVWTADPDGILDISRTLGIAGGLTLGSELLASAYMRLELPRYSVSNSTASRVLAESFGGLRGYTLNSGTAGGLGSAVNGYELVGNAKLDAATGQWSRLVAGDAVLLQLGTNGLRVYHRAAALASPWADETNVTTGWNLVSTYNDSSRPNRLIPSVGSESPPVASALYQANVPKAWGVTISDGAGGFSTNAGFNLGAVTFAAGALRIHVATPFASAAYCVVANISGYTAIARPRVIDTDDFEIAAYDDAGAAINLSSTAGIVVHFVAFGLQ